MRAVHPAVWLIPASMLVIAVMPLPYDYFKLLRLIVTGCAGYIAYAAWDEEGSQSLWMAAFVCIALLFNPLVPIHLNKTLWLPIDLLSASIFVAHWWKLSR